MESMHELRYFFKGEEKKNTFESHKYMHSFRSYSRVVQKENI